MTRFLSHGLADLEGGGVNEETDRLFAYHHATKHSYHSVRTNAHFLDWHNQPDPFRTYEGAPLITLPTEPGFPLARTFATMAAVAEGARTDRGGKFEYQEEVQLDVAWLSRLLWHSMAISAWKKVPRTGDHYSLRVNPSSGNLHPTETHLALLGFTGIDDGLYHYRADRHAIELRRGGNWTEQIARALVLPWAAESPLIVGLTSIFWREAWKYRPLHQTAERTDATHHPRHGHRRTISHTSGNAVSLDNRTAQRQATRPHTSASGPRPPLLFLSSGIYSRPPITEFLNCLFF